MRIEENGQTYWVAYPVFPDNKPEELKSVPVRRI